MAVINEINHTIITVEHGDSVRPSPLGESLINLGGGVLLELAFSTKEQRDLICDAINTVMAEIRTSMVDD